jgi:hypothetical protein
MTTLAENNNEPLIKNMTDSHDNQIYRILFQKTKRHSLPVEIVILNVKQTLSIASLIIKFNDGFFVSFPIIGQNEQIVICIVT